jgi:hypothetical protein
MPKKLDMKAELKDMRTFIQDAGIVFQPGKNLLPCPFCGSKAIIYEIAPHKHIMVNLPEYSGSAFVECSCCTVALSGQTLEEASKNWNQRSGQVL